jgi:hypothetical protein
LNNIYLLKILSILLIKALRVACLFGSVVRESRPFARSDRAPPPPPPRPSRPCLWQPPHPTHRRAGSTSLTLRRHRPQGRSTANSPPPPTAASAISPSPSPPSPVGSLGFDALKETFSWTCRRPARARSASRLPRPSPSCPLASPRSPTSPCASSSAAAPSARARRPCCPPSPPRTNRRRSAARAGRAPRSPLPRSAPRRPVAGRCRCAPGTRLRLSEGSAGSLVLLRQVKFALRYRGGLAGV